MNNHELMNDEPTASRQRTAFLIRCTEAEASMIRCEAERQDCTISGYVLAALDREIKMDKLSTAEINLIHTTSAGTRTALLIRCNISEADQIRDAARQREMSRNSFALYCLRRSWNLGRIPDPLIPVIARHQASIPSNASTPLASDAGH